MEFSLADEIIPFVERHLDEMVGIVTELGDAKVNQRPDLREANTPYAIVNHCTCVVNWWGGYQIAGRDVERDRPAEFTGCGDVASLATAVAKTKTRLRNDLADVDLTAPVVDPGQYPEKHIVRTWTKAAALVHLLEELAQHHGQLDLTRDLLVGGTV